MKANYLIIMVIGLLNGCSPSDQENASVAESHGHEPDPLIVAKLQEIVELREYEYRVLQLERELGQGAMDGVAEMALANARIALARELGQADLVVVELGKIVKELEKTLARENALAEEDRLDQSRLAGLRVALLEAEVRWRRAVIAQPGGAPSSETTDPGK